MAVSGNYSIGVDLGGTNLRAAAIDSTGNVLGKSSGHTDLQDGRDAESTISSLPSAPFETSSAKPR